MACVLRVGNQTLGTSKYLVLVLQTALLANIKGYMLHRNVVPLTFNANVYLQTAGTAYLGIGLLGLIHPPGRLAF